MPLESLWGFLAACDGGEQRRVSLGICAHLRPCFSAAAIPAPFRGTGMFARCRFCPARSIQQCPRRCAARYCLMHPTPDPPCSRYSTRCGSDCQTLWGGGVCRAPVVNSSRFRAAAGLRCRRRFIRARDRQSQLSLSSHAFLRWRPCCLFAAGFAMWQATAALCSSFSPSCPLCFLHSQLPAGLLLALTRTCVLRPRWVLPRAVHHARTGRPPRRRHLSVCTAITETYG